MGKVDGSVLAVIEVSCLKSFTYNNGHEDLNTVGDHNKTEMKNKFLLHKKNLLQILDFPYFPIVSVFFTN